MFAVDPPAIKKAMTAITNITIYAGMMLPRYCGEWVSDL